MLKGRLIVQDLNRLQFGWDDDIPLVNQHEWMAWLATLGNVNDLSVNRCVVPEKFGEVVSSQVHHFADASEVAYGSVSYRYQGNECFWTYLLFFLKGQAPFGTSQESNDTAFGTHYSNHGGESMLSNV